MRTRNVSPVLLTAVTLAAVCGCSATSPPDTPSGRSPAEVTPTPTAVTPTPTAVTPTPTAAAAPVLGDPAAFPFGNLQGFGEVRPSTVSYGGDPTGMVWDIAWSSWGGSTATGTGTSVDDTSGVDVADAPTNAATIYAYDLGTCDGRLEYQEVIWYFPADGQTLTQTLHQSTDDTGISACKPWTD